MRPQDVVLLLKILLLEETEWQSKDLASTLLLSPAEISFSLKRCHYARLLDSTGRRVARRTLTEFLLYGLSVVFPTQPGAQARGLPTAHRPQRIPALPPDSGGANLRLARCRGRGLGRGHHPALPESAGRRPRRCSAL